MSDRWHEESADTIVQEIRDLEDTTDDYYQSLEDKLLLSPTKKENPEKLFKLLRAMRKLERVADHAVSISHLLSYATKGGKLQAY